MREHFNTSSMCQRYLDTKTSQSHHNKSIDQYPSQTYTQKFLTNFSKSHPVIYLKDIT